MDPNGSDRTEDRGDQTRKRPYEPPRVLSEEIFETTALACGKMAPGGAACNVSNKNS